MECIPFLVDDERLAFLPTGLAACSLPRAAAAVVASTELLSVSAARRSEDGDESAVRDVDDSRGLSL